MSALESRKEQGAMQERGTSRNRGRWWRCLATCLLLVAACLSTLQAAETTTYVLTDDQGTVLALADSHGNVTARFDNRPYGKQQSGPVNAGPGYTGHVNDPDTGFVFMQQRYYDAELGRFLSVDPVRPSPNELFGFNRYGYVNNSPISNVDPDGESPWNDGNECRSFSDCRFQNWQNSGDNGGGSEKNGKSSFWDRIKNSFRPRTQSEQATDLRKFYAGLGAYDPITGKVIDIGSLSDAELIAFNKEHRQDFANGGWKVVAGAIGSIRFTTPQARDLANRYGFRQVKRDWNTHGQAVFEKDGRYITPDVDSHSGGTWKELNSRGQRIATLDHNLNVIGK